VPSVPSPARLLGVVAVVAAAAVAATTVGGSGAAFVSRSPAHPASVRSASLALDSSRAGQPIVLDTDGLRPGDVRSGEVTVTSTGDQDGQLAFDVIAGGPLGSVVQISVERCAALTGSCAPATEVAAPVALDAAGSHDLGTLAAGVAQRYRVTLAWPAADDGPDLQGTSATASLSFSLRSGS
jgi:hypothetical protein